jgi:integrase
MKKFAKPWYRPSRGVWYVTLRGKQHNLGPAREAAFRRYGQLIADPPKAEPREPVAVPPVYLVGLIQRFMEDIRVNGAPDTVEWYRYRLQRFLDYLGGRNLEALQVGELKRSHVKEWINTYPHLSSGSRRNFCRAIVRVMNWAVEQEHIRHNQLARMKKPKAGKRERMISDAEWQEILSLAGDDDLHDLLIVTWETGCRPQESLIVETRHVDLANQRWVFPIAESKTDLPRVVYLTDRALEVVKRRMHGAGRIFRNSDGNPWTTDAVNCAFTRIQIRMGQGILRERGTEIGPEEIAEFAKTLKRERRVKGKMIRKTERELLQEAARKLAYRRAAKLAPKFCLYTIRHTWMNRLLTSGVDALTVAILAGHCDPSTLAKTYQHLSQNPKYMLEQAKKIG